MSGIQNVKQHIDPKYITIDGVKKRLQFDMNAFGELEKRFGSLDAAMESLSSGKLSDIKVILWAGIIHGEVSEFDDFTGEPISYKVTPYQVGASIQMSDLPEISQALAAAFSTAMPTEDEVKKALGPEVPAPANLQKA